MVTTPVLKYLFIKMIIWSSSCWRFLGCDILIMIQFHFQKSLMVMISG